ncbi:hypothetical protein IEQ34_004679 [Dendrobium chrysotoxum]|uniref:Uncharacterized protein n=1 Tax=Dendrobium chrysotoxum TaxID=161865 RepID=A0AAV7HEL9_DENCH|nr:hypothetical protein IEQ34_004679 [Dendrobium chrysotoxum]
MCITYHSLGYSKVECCVLHPHLNNHPMIIPRPPVQPSTSLQGNSGDGMVLGCGEVDVVSDVGIQAVELPLVRCGNELVFELVLSTPIIGGANALDNLVAADVLAIPINNLDPLSVGLDHPLDDMVDDGVARVKSPNDNVVSDANQNVDGGHCLGNAMHRLNIEMCDVNKVVLIDSSSDLNTTIPVSPMASLGVSLTPNVGVFKENELVFDAPISVVSNAELKAQLALTVNNDDPSDWLEDSSSLACEGAEGDLVDYVDELQEMYAS